MSFCLLGLCLLCASALRAFVIESRRLVYIQTLVPLPTLRLDLEWDLWAQNTHHLIFPCRCLRPSLCLFISSLRGIESRAHKFSHFGRQAQSMSKGMKTESYAPSLYPSLPILPLSRSRATLMLSFTPSLRPARDVSTREWALFHES